MGIWEKVAYLKGLADGIKLDASTDEGRLMYAVIDALGSVAVEAAELRQGQNNLSEAVDAISDDLADIEELFSGNDGEDAAAGYEATRPACGETVRFDEEVLEEGEIVCPNCGQKLEFDLEASDADEPAEKGDEASDE
ncbi:MAG: hypothetical protein IKN96_08600 [Oscillibacter sp.]|nr:hypothetical protein [Oscillibacter sp.]